MSALLTTAVEANAIFPVTLVTNKPVGIMVIWHPLVDPVGAVMVLIVVVPETKA